jgi:hypothetical protein
MNHLKSSFMKNYLRKQVHRLLFLAVLLQSLALTAQDDKRESRIFETGEFTGLFLEGAFGVELIQGNTHSLEVRVSDSKAFDYLKITNERGLLHLHVDRKPFDFSRITLYVTFETLTSLRIFGSIKLETHGYLDLNHINLLVEGGARVKFQVVASHISLENKGGVMVELLGVTESLNVRLAGAGHINAGELKSRDVEFRVDGVGTGRVFATHTLRAQIKGAGKLRYRGDPQVTQNIEGLGSVSRDEG